MAGTVPYDRVELDLRGRPLHVHLLGIGGAGMSAIAEILVALGHRVSGTDRAAGPAIERLRSLGVDAVVGHDAAAVAGADVVGVSTAIAPDNPEIVAARAAGIPVAHRYDLLAAIGRTRRTLSVSGTHGKTTTSSLLAGAMEGAGLDPCFLVGGTVAAFGAGARWTDGDWFVLEADESDSTFLAPPRAGAIVTNVEADHLDHHGDLASLVAAFEQFVGETDGPVLVCADDPGAAALAIGASILRYGTATGADVTVSDVEARPTGTAWTVRGPWGSDRLQVGAPGHHLVLNATAAFGLAVAVGADRAGAAAGIAAFRGVGRRFEVRGEAGGVRFVDDYAHTPTEVRAVLAAARTAHPDGRVVAVFQPHRYSRTAAVGPEYGTAFDDADVVVVTEIYAAGEAPVAGVTGGWVADGVRAARPAADVRFAAARDELVDLMAGLLRPGDLCLTMGAGDLTSLPDALVARLGGGGGGGDTR